MKQWYVTQRKPLRYFHPWDFPDVKISEVTRLVILRLLKEGLASDKKAGTTNT